MVGTEGVAYGGCSPSNIQVRVPYDLLLQFEEIRHLLRHRVLGVTFCLVSGTTGRLVGSFPGSVGWPYPRPPHFMLTSRLVFVTSTALGSLSTGTSPSAATTPPSALATFSSLAMPPALASCPTLASSPALAGRPTLTSRPHYVRLPLPLFTRYLPNSRTASLSAHPFLACFFVSVLWVGLGRRSGPLALLGLQWGRLSFGHRLVVMQLALAVQVPCTGKGQPHGSHQLHGDPAGRSGSPHLVKCLA